jgi:hypothetical protein
MVRVSCLDTRGVRVVTKREAGCGGRGRRRLTSGAILGRRSRVVLAPQCLGAKLATMLAHRADDGGKRDGSPGRARISRKPLRREGRSVSACTCGLRAFAHLSCAKRPRVQRAPGLPCALGIFEGDVSAKLGRMPSRERGRTFRPSCGISPSRPGQASDSERRSGTHNPRILSCEERPPPRATERFRGLGPGFRRDDDLPKQGQPF